MQFNWIKSIDIIENLGSVCGLISINRDWKESCDFIGNYITFILIPVNKSACLDLPNCTHFVGNADIDGGMCFLKAGYTTYKVTTIPFHMLARVSVESSRAGVNFINMLMQICYAR